jgi:hypothetical protein
MFRSLIQRAVRAACKVKNDAEGSAQTRGDRLTFCCLTAEMSNHRIDWDIPSFCPVAPRKFLGITIVLSMNDMIPTVESQKDVYECEVSLNDRSVADHQSGSDQTRQTTFTIAVNGFHLVSEAGDQ